MDLGLQNKNIIVTGGTRGIGLAAAAACAAEGANISICGRTQDSLDAAMAALAAHGLKSTVRSAISPTPSNWKPNCCRRSRIRRHRWFGQQPQRLWQHR